jgi:hypothetical protein
MKLHVFRITNGAAERLAADGKLPDRLKILNWGDNPAIEGINPKLGSHTLKMFSALMAKKGLDRVALDFEHNTVPGTVEYERTQEPRAIAAHGPAELIPGDGLYLTNLSYTPHGNGFALEYPDLSPAVHIDPATGEVDFLHSCALTRAGAVLGLSYYSVEARIEDKATTSKGDEMDWKKMLIKLTGAADDVSDEDLAKMFEAKISSVATAAAEPVQVALSALSATVAALKPAEGQEGEITALSGKVAALGDVITTLSGELVAMRRQGVREQAAREGKVIPLSAEQIEGMDPKVLAEMVGKLPVTVPIDRRTPEHIAALSVAGVTSALKTVAERCGMDPAKVAEANKA